MSNEPTPKALPGPSPDCPPQSSSKPFTPVPLRARHDGWTAARQIAFLEALAETCCIHEACRRVGMSDTAAYDLRRREDAGNFRAAWDAALDCSTPRLEQAAFARSLRGVARPVFYKGEQVGEWRHYDERLTMFLLRYRRPERYGGWIDRSLPPPPEHEIADDSADRLAWHCAEIEDDEAEAAIEAPAATPTGDAAGDSPQRLGGEDSEV